MTDRFWVIMARVLPRIRGTPAGRRIGQKLAQRSANRTPTDSGATTPQEVVQPTNVSSMSLQNNAPLVMSNPYPTEFPQSFPKARQNNVPYMPPPRPNLQNMAPMAPPFFGGMNMPAGMGYSTAHFVPNPQAGMPNGNGQYIGGPPTMNAPNAWGWDPQAARQKMPHQNRRRNGTQHGSNDFGGFHGASNSSGSNGRGSFGGHSNQPQFF
jgi:hypothetical protein